MAISAAGHAGVDKKIMCEE